VIRTDHNKQLMPKTDPLVKTKGSLAPTR